MITTTRTWDYTRQARPAAGIVTKELAILDWVMTVQKWYDRGLITWEEMSRLLRKGPKAK